jgi:hypothetical protein
MLQVLQQTATAEALQAAAKQVVKEHSTNRPGAIPVDQLPDILQRVMRSLGLSEASVLWGGARVLRMDAPGGFASYGVDIALPGTGSTEAANAPPIHGMTELDWTNGISVWYFVQ